MAAANSGKVRTGSCLCQSIKYTVTGEPLTFRVCHCVNCKKASGSAFMTNVFYKDENITITQGSGLLKIFQDTQTESGFPMLRYFCSKCGSNLFMQPGDNVSVDKGLKIISYGCLDREEGDGRWPVRKEIFPDQRLHFVQIERGKAQPKL